MNGSKVIEYFRTIAIFSRGWLSSYFRVKGPHVWYLLDHILLHLSHPLYPECQLLLSCLVVLPALDPLSLSVVEVTTTRTGQTVCGPRRMISSSLIAAVKLPLTSAASGTIPPTSTGWR